MTEVAGDLHCLACGYVADVPMEAWDECEGQKDARIAALEAENERHGWVREQLIFRMGSAGPSIAFALDELDRRWAERITP